MTELDREITALEKKKKQCVSLIQEKTDVVNRELKEINDLNKIRERIAALNKDMEEEQKKGEANATKVENKFEVLSAVFTLFLGKQSFRTIPAESQRKICNSSY